MQGKQAYLDVVHEYYLWCTSTTNPHCFMQGKQAYLDVVHEYY